MTIHKVYATTDNGARLRDVGDEFGRAFGAFIDLISELFTGDPPAAHTLSAGEMAGLLGSLAATIEAVQNTYHLVDAVAHGEMFP